MCNEKLCTTNTNDMPLDNGVAIRATKTKTANDLTGNGGKTLERKASAGGGVVSVH